MTEQLVPLERLAKKGLRISLRVPEVQFWDKQVKADPLLPRNRAQLRRLWRTILAGRNARRLSATRLTHGVLAPRFEWCGEKLYSRFFAGLANPHLSAADRSAIEAEVDADTPAFDGETQTDHFVLRWTTSSVHPEDNIADAAVVTETGDYLEAAWATYTAVFGRAPSVLDGATKIEVNFFDIAGYGVAFPDGPIQFNAGKWINEPGIRRSTSAHELFHKLQYSFGYRTVWPLNQNYEWFSEGTATWAEVFVWQRLALPKRLTELFDHPGKNLYAASYDALPFWIFFDTRQRDTLTDIPLVGFMQRYENTGDEHTAMAEAIDDDWPADNAYGQVDHFFSLFSRERLIGAWRQTPTGGQPYAAIVDPDGVAITPVLSITDVPLDAGVAFSDEAIFLGMSSCYYRFLLPSDSDGQTLNVAIIERGGPNNCSYCLVWEKGGAYQRSEFPFYATGDFSFGRPIELATADALVLIVSSRGVGSERINGYTLTASVT